MKLEEKQDGRETNLHTLSSIQKRQRILWQCCQMLALVVSWHGSIEHSTSHS